MEETSQDPVGIQESAVRDEPEVNQAKKDTVAYETYKKLLGEKKSRDERNTQLENKLRDYEQRDLQSKGQYEEVILSLKGEVGELKGQIAKRDEAYIMSKVESAVKTKALELGCVNPDKLLRLLDSEKIRGLEIDSNYNVSSRDVEYLVNEGKKENDFLFRKNKANVTDADPVEKPIVALPKTINKMSNAELENAIRQAHSQGS